MSDLLTVQQALVKVMADLPAIGKDGKADQKQGGYAYRGIEQITKHAQGLFAVHGIVVVPAVRSIAVKDITVNDKPWTDTTLIVDYNVFGPDGSSVAATCVGIGRDNSDKGANKAMTQAFKYLLLQLLCISDAKDDADGSTHEADARPTYPAVVTQTFERLRSLSDDGKAALKVWGNGRAFTLDALSDQVWRDEVVKWLDEFQRPAAVADHPEIEPTP